jgi:hypothetical protein
MERKLSAGYAGLLFLAFAFICFPGGAILMALACNSRRLDGWDWVLSVIIPAYPHSQTRAPLTRRSSVRVRAPCLQQPQSR